MTNTRELDPLQLLAAEIRRVYPVFPDGAWIRLGMLFAMQHPEWVQAYVRKSEDEHGPAPTGPLHVIVETFPIERAL